MAAGLREGALLLVLLAVAAPSNAAPWQGDTVELLQEHAEVQSALATQDLSEAAGAALQAPVVVNSTMINSTVNSTATNTTEDLVTNSTGGTAGRSISSRAFVAEFVAMALFVFFGCGSAMSIAKEDGSAWVLQVSLSFGLAITVLAYSIGHISGGQINCAVTLGLVIYGHVGFWQGVCNFIAQLLGSLLGAIVLKAMYPVSKDLTGGLATNSVAPGWTTLGALIGEFVGTFLLMFVVFHTAVNDATAANSALAPLAIGLSVFLAHSVLIPVDGCSINPTRTFGPAVIHSLTSGSAEVFNGMWVFWLGPLAGAAAAAGVYALMEL